MKIHNQSSSAKHCNGLAKKLMAGILFLFILIALTSVDARYKVGDTFRDCATCTEMVVVPAGSFMMGSLGNEKNRFDDEGPRHRVTISKPFAVGKYEVTREQYKEFSDAVGDAISHDWIGNPFDETDNHSVADVSWDDAKAYVAWLSKKTKKEYRLLSEAEWEYVARAGTTTRYHFGDTISSTQARYWHKRCNDYKVFDSNPCWGTVTVGSHPANAFGLHDVHGNVWEWVEDCWHENYQGAPRNGSAWTSNCSGRFNPRVLRGGSWDNRSGDLRSAYRFWGDVRYYGGHVGFRVTRALTL